MSYFNISIHLVYLILFASSCSSQNEKSDPFEKNIQLIAEQQKLQLEDLEQLEKVLMPRTVIDGKTRYVSREDWTSGFYPGSMWYMYALTGDSIWKSYARKYTKELDSAKYLTWHHDIGFIIQCSFGNGLMFGEYNYQQTIITAAKSLSSRFRPEAGVIQSWDVDKGWMSKRGWECPVIIDNMMNLELLFNATKLSGDSSFYRIAVSHADRTIENHYRQDYSSYHVIDYNPIDGSVRSKETAQGFANESAWSRGQAWGIYGFVVCYRETGNPRYLEQAQKAIEFIVNHPNFPSDYVPYWDLDAPNIPNEPRDASSAAIMASALFELSNYINYDYYSGLANKILKSLSSSSFRANLGENRNFLLKHSVGSIPHGAEIDVPLNYADYYYLEALLRSKKVKH